MFSQEIVIYKFTFEIAKGDIMRMRGGTPRIAGEPRENRLN